jgi:tetratricopeptide (TPR) repeat protein
MSDPTDEREFLLRSLEDLDREHDAGDLEDADYTALKDDYTARAAAALRSSGAERAPVPSSPRRGAPRGLLVIGGVLLFAILAGVAVAQSSGRRDEGELGSGDVRASITERLNDAGRLLSEGEAEEAIELYDDVLTDQPTNAEAATYKGWAQYIVLGDREAGFTSLLAAGTDHPDYPDVHAFLAVAFFREGLVEEAGRELDVLDALDPSPAMLELTEGLRARIDAILAASSTTTTTVAPSQPSR